MQIQNYNGQKKTRKEVREAKKKKGLKGLTNPMAIYYLVIKPSIDVVVAVVMFFYDLFNS